MGHLLDFVCSETEKYYASFTKDERKKIGQFFTSKETAIYMSELLTIPNHKDIIKVLDPGQVRVF